MAIVQAMVTSFKVELMEAIHNFSNPGGNVFNLALFRSQSLISGSYGAATTNYSNMSFDEVAGTNYTTGGLPLTNTTPMSAGTTAFTDFADLVFSNVTLISSGCLIYNLTAGGNAVGVFNFGSDKIVTAGDFTVVFPAVDANSAIIRLI